MGVPNPLEKHMNRKKILFPILVLFLGALSTYVVMLMGGKKIVVTIKNREIAQVRPEVPPPLVRVQTVELEDLQLVVPAQGTVAPRTESTLVAQVAGQITRVSPAFANGGFFEKGAVLLTIDPRDYEVAVAQANVQVAQAKLRLAREEEEGAIARDEWQRLGDGEPTALVLREPQIAEARATLAAAEGALARAHLNLERTQIRAPYPGRVRAKSADVGQYVNPGSPVGRIYAVDYAEVRLPVPDDQLAYLTVPLSFRNRADAKGPNARFYATFAGREHAYMGRIVRVEGEIDPRSRMVTLVGRVDNPYRQRDSNRPPLAVGMFVTAEILGHRAEEVAAIPRVALRGKDRVLVVIENRLYYRAIDILRADAATVVVKAGLNSGDQLCVSPLDTVVDGMRVRVTTQTGGTP